MGRGRGRGRMYTQNGARPKARATRGATVY